MKELLFFVTLFVSTVANAETIHFNKYNMCSLEVDVNSDSMYDLKKCLSEKHAIRGFAKYPIYLYLNSPGGSIVDGLSFIEYAKTIPNLHTVTMFAASMAAAIVQHLPGKRYVLASGVTMFHRARGTFSGQFSDGELESRLSLWKKIVTTMEQTQASRIGITLEEYKKNSKDEWWLYGTENVKENVSDQVVKARCSDALIKDRKMEKVDSLFGSYEFEMSACPLVN